MPRQQTEKYERICISNFLVWYNNKFHALYKCHGHSRNIYGTELQGKKDWDWVCRDANGSDPEMAIEILSVSFKDLSIRSGAAYNVFYRVKKSLDCHLPGDFFLWVPDDLTAHLLTKQEQRNIADQLVSVVAHKLNELCVLPEWHCLDIQVGNNTFTLDKRSPNGCTLLDAFMATSFYIDTNEIKELLAQKIPEKNTQLEIPREWGFITILLIQSFGAPHHIVIKDIVHSIGNNEKSNIDKTFIVQAEHVFEVEQG